MLRFDHLIFWVQDPQRMGAVCAGFEQAGFTITDRLDAGRETAAAQQRLICFEDGSYVEILTLRDAASREKHRLARFGATGDGWADYSLVTEDLQTCVTRLTEAGLPFDGPKSHEKTLEDGRPWGVRLINPGRVPGHPAAPFVLEDLVGAELRVPRHSTVHTNGARAMLGVRLVVADLAQAEATLGVLMGAPEAVVTLPEGAAAGHRYWLEQTWVDVFAPTSGAGPLSALLEARGEGVYSAAFSGPAGHTLDLADAGSFADAEVLHY